MKIVLLLLYVVVAKLKNSIVLASAGFANDPKGPLLLKSEKHLNITVVDKPSLRYGFQQTRECKDYQLAFTCIRKCLDLGYQIAYADKSCFCKCKHNTNIAKFKPPTFGPTKWKSGAPTTSLPYWVKKHTTAKLASKDKIPIDNIEIYGDITVPVDGHTKSDKDSKTSSDIITESNNNTTDYNTVDPINGNATDTNNGTNIDNNTNIDTNTNTTSAADTDTNNTNTTTTVETNTNNTSTNTNGTDTK